MSSSVAAKGASPNEMACVNLKIKFLLQITSLNRFNVQANNTLRTVLFIRQLAVAAALLHCFLRKHDDHSGQRKDGCCCCEFAQLLIPWLRFFSFWHGLLSYHHFFIKYFVGLHFSYDSGCGCRPSCVFLVFFCVVGVASCSSWCTCSSSAPVLKLQPRLSPLPGCSACLVVGIVSVLWKLLIETLLTLPLPADRTDLQTPDSQVMSETHLCTVCKATLTDWIKFVWVCF